VTGGACSSCCAMLAHKVRRSCWMSAGLMPNSAELTMVMVNCWQALCILLVKSTSCMACIQRDIIHICWTPEALVVFTAEQSVNAACSVFASHQTGKACIVAV